MDRDRNRNPLDNPIDNDAPIPSMSTDNTGEASSPADSMDSEILNQVREGMDVVDANDDKIGSVEYVSMGDPGAVTVDSTGPERDTGILGDVARAFGAEGEPDVPEPLRSRLLRVGYIKVDGPGWIDTDRYITADRIAGVSSDTVRLNVTKDAIVSED